jgi:hypothetical protein
VTPKAASLGAIGNEFDRAACAHDDPAQRHQVALRARNRQYVSASIWKGRRNKEELEKARTRLKRPAV